MASQTGESPQLLRRMRLRTPQGSVEMHLLQFENGQWGLGVDAANGLFTSLRGQQWRFDRRYHTYQFWKWFKTWAIHLTGKSVTDRPFTI